MEIIIKSRIKTYILPYSLWKSLQKSVLGNESRQPLHGIVGRCLKKLMSSQFILCKPFQEKQENKSFACSVCIQIQPVKYCSVCQTGKYLDTGKQRSVPFIQ